MKVLFASIPAAGHFNPPFVAARMLKKAGHETAIYTGTLFREKIEAAGVRFFPLPKEADQDVLDRLAQFLQRNKYTPGPEEMLEIFKGFFVDPMLAQFRGLQQILKKFPADVVVHETSFCGVLPMLLGPRSERPASACLGISTVPLEREDGAPWGAGLLPTKDGAKRKEYAEITREVNEKKELPLRKVADRMLAEIGLPGLPGTIFASTGLLADMFLQSCVPSFEFPLREPAKKVHFIGALVPEGSGDVPPQVKEAKKTGRKVVLVSQGTVANNELGKLLAPTIQALGDRDDFLILATTGGKPIENIPCAIPANTVASQFINFTAIMPHVDVLVALGSYGTVTQALSFGLPMVVAGKSEDKPEVGAHVTATGCGIELRTDTPSPEQIRDAVGQVLTKPEYRANAEKLRREFAAVDTAKELTQLLESLVEEQVAVAK
jgi:MGT family glycosyltransferase